MPTGRRSLIALLAAALCLAPLPFRPAAAADQVLDKAMHHLRHGPDREWSDFPERAEAAEWAVRFDATANAAGRAIRLRHRDVKQVWRVAVNGRDLGPLPQDENEMVTYLNVPPGALRDGGNELRVSCPAGAAASDDVMVGEVALLDRPAAEVLSEAVVDVAVTDADSGGPIPCRITLAEDRGGLAALGTPSDGRLAVRPGVVYTADGRARVALPAGRYTVYAGRGFEYGVASATVEPQPGKPAEARLAIRRVFPTPGYVACDTHVHTFTYSRHGDATIDERMLTLAGEGIELPVAADHNLQIDYRKPAERMKVAGYFTPVIGNEVTTAAAGHFNVFPVPPESKLINWRVRDWAAVGRNVAEVAGGPGPGGPVVVLNHARDIHGGFRPFDPARHLAVTGDDLDGWTLPANAMEVVNSGATMNDPMRLFRDWFGMLNAGHRLTPVGASDSHDVSRYIVGQGRTYVRCPDADPGHIDVDRARRALLEGRVLISYGLLADIEVDGRAGPGDVVTAREGKPLMVKVRVLGPEWTRATHVTLYADGAPVREAEIVPGDGPGEKFSATFRLDRPRHDVYLVAIATGPGVSAPYWPMARPYQPTSPDWRPYVLGSTGAVWVDADGDGRYSSPRQYASAVVAKAGDDPAAVARGLAGYDEAVAAQAAGILRQRLGDRFDAARRPAARDADPAVRRGFEAVLDEWAQARAARTAAATRPAG